MAKLATGGWEVLALGGSWHGVTGMAGAVSFASDRRGTGPSPPACTSSPSPTPTAVLSSTAATPAT